MFSPICLMTFNQLSLRSALNEASFSFFQLNPPELSLIREEYLAKNNSKVDMVKIRLQSYCYIVATPSLSAVSADITKTSMEKKEKLIFQKNN